MINDASGKKGGMRRAVFLDRDGTLGGDGGYCHPDEFQLFPTAALAIGLLNASGFSVIVVTNQTHVGRGDIALEQVDASCRRLNLELAADAARLDGWYFCPHPKADACLCRKPSPYLLHKAAHDFHVDLAASWMVGDAGATDMLAGRAAGCRLPAHPRAHRLGRELPRRLSSYLGRCRARRRCR